MRRELVTIGSLHRRPSRRFLGRVRLGDAALDAAAAVNEALAAHGYNVADMGLYEAFAHAQGIPADDASGDVFPGRNFMTQLRAVLLDGGITPANVPTYPWKAGAYDGVNAPLLSEWQAPLSSSGGGAVLVLPTVTIVGDHPAAGAGTTDHPAAGGSSSSSSSHTGAWVLGGLAAAGVAFVGLRMMKKKRRRGRRAARPFALLMA